MTVKELIEELQKLNPDTDIMICAREENTNPLYVFEHYHKGDITAVTFHYLDDATEGKYMIEANDTFTEYVRI